MKWQKGRQPRRLLCFSAAFFVVDLLFCTLFQENSSISQVILCTAAAGIAAALALTFCLRKETLTLLPLLVGLLAGFLWCSGYTVLVWQPKQQYDNHWGSVLLEVTDPAIRTEEYCSVSGLVTEIDGKSCRLKVKAYLKEELPDILPGDAVRFFGEFSAAKRDFRRNMLQKGQFLTISQHGEAEVLPASAQTPLRQIRLISVHVRERALELLPGDEGALLAALLSGGRADFSPKMKQALSVSGMSHITAVSGLHISILAGLMLWVFGKRAGLLIAVPASLLYAGLAGFTPSVMRAVILLSFWSASFWLKQEKDPLTALAAALLVLTLYQPFSCKSISLQLSFAAALGLMQLASPIQKILYQPISKLKNKVLKGLFRYAAGVLSATIAATLFTMPITMLHFDVVPLFSLLANVLTLWTLSFLILFSVAVLLISAISFNAAAFLARWVLHWPLLWVVTVIRRIGGFRFAAADAANLALAGASLLILVCLLLWRWKKLSGRRLVLLVSAVCCTAAILTTGQRLLTDEVRISNCGAPLFLVRGETFSVIGSGGQPDLLQREVGRSALQWNQPIIDTAICTRNHKKGQYAIPDDALISRLLFPDIEQLPAEIRKRQPEMLESGTEYDLGGVKAQLLYSNDHIYALRLFGRRFSIISFCGLNGSQAELILKRYQCSADVLVLDDQLLKYRDAALSVIQQVNPKQVLLICGRFADEKAYFHQIPLTNVGPDGVRFRFMR